MGSEKADCVFEVFIGSLNPIVTDALTAIPVDAGEGETEVTAGGVVSAVVVVKAPEV